MKVLVLGREYPTTANQMCGSFELEQAQMLARAGMEVFYLMVDIRSIRRMRRFGFYCKMEDGVNLAVCSIPIGPIFSQQRLNRIYARFREKLIFWLAKKKGIPDVIHVHYPSLFPYRLVQPWQEKGVKIVATEHWSAVQCKTLDGYCLQNLRDFAARADAFCCVGAGLQTSLRQLTGRKDIFIVPNVVNHVFKPGKIPHKGFRFVCSGRLVPLKQYDMVIEAFVDVFHDNKDVSLTVAGDGSEAGWLRSLIAVNKAEDQVHMPGALAREKMAELIASSDVLVVFSRIETFCVPVIEAWACGKPVITSKTTVFMDNPDERLGIIADYRDPDSLREAFRQIYHSYKDYDPEWIARYADIHFSERVVSGQLYEIYR